MSLDTINIESLVDQFSKDLLNVEADAAYAALISQFPVLAFENEILKPLYMEIITDVLKYFNDRLGFVAFQFNTKVWTSDQGKDYISQVEKLDALPDDVPDEIWDAQEQATNHAFAQLANLKS